MIWCSLLRGPVSCEVFLFHPLFVCLHITYSKHISRGCPPVLVFFQCPDLDPTPFPEPRVRAIVRGHSLFRSFSLCRP